VREVELISSMVEADFLGKDAWIWLVFIAIVVVLLVVDLGLLHRKPREIPESESLWLSAAYMAIALAFGAWIWFEMGSESGMAYLTGYFIEKSLALDNVFVISIIFGYFAIPRLYQHRVLFWGILGVIVLRGIMIALGSALVSQFSWILYVFGAFLILTGFKMMVMANTASSLEDNPVLRILRSRLNITADLHGSRFFVRQRHPISNKLTWFATPLFLALALIEFADLVFAVDSVPAIFAITTDPYLVYTSNIFAILGLRALYFALAAMVHRFHYLKYALSVVLVFIGCKIFYNQIVGKIDPAISLGVTLALLTGGVLFSLWKTRSNLGRDTARLLHNPAPGCITDSRET
jgi:tellurite resistance protein TerC